MKSDICLTLFLEVQNVLNYRETNYVLEFSCASRQLDAAWREVVDLSSVLLEASQLNNLHSTTN